MEIKEWASGWFRFGQNLEYAFRWESFHIGYARWDTFYMDIGQVVQTTPPPAWNYIQVSPDRVVVDEFLPSPHHQGKERLAYILELEEI